MSDELDVSDLLEDLIRYPRLLTAFVVAGLSISILIGGLSTPKYRVELVLSIVDEGGGASAVSGLMQSIGGLASLANFALPASSNRGEVYVATLLSNSFTKDFIEENNLRPILFPDKWDSATQNWSVEADKVPTPFDAVQFFDSDIRSLSRDKATGLMTLSVDWSNPDVAAEWALGLIRAANSRIRQQVIDEAELSIQFLNAEYEKTHVIGLQQAIFRLIESQIHKIMLANVRHEYAFEIVDPPLIPDNDNKIWPNWPLLIFGGVMLGSGLGMLLSVMISRKAESTDVGRG